MFATAPATSPAARRASVAVASGGCRVSDVDDGFWGDERLRVTEWVNASPLIAYFTSVTLEEEERSCGIDTIGTLSSRE